MSAYIVKIDWLIFESGGKGGLGAARRNNI